MFASTVDQTAEALAGTLGELMATPPVCETKAIVTGKAGELIDVEQQQLVKVLFAANWDARLLLIASRPTVFAFLEAVLGGEVGGEVFDVEREFSQIETAIAELMFRQFGDALQSSFGQVSNPRIEPQATMASVDLDSIGGAGAAIVLVRFSAEMIGRNVELLLAVPQFALTANRDELQNVEADDEACLDPKWSEHFDRQVRRTDTKLTAVLDGGQLMLDDISRFQEGQVIALSCGPDTPVRVSCNDQQMLWCRLGQSDGGFVLKVEQIGENEQELMDELLAGDFGGLYD